MKNNYSKYIKEVWKMKNDTYNDYKKSGFKSYVDFIKNDMLSDGVKTDKKKKIA